MKTLWNRTEGFFYAQDALGLIWAPELDQHGSFCLAH